MLCPMLLDPAHFLSITAWQQAGLVLHSALQLGGYVVVVIDCFAHLKHVTFEAVVGGKLLVCRSKQGSLVASAV